MNINEGNPSEDQPKSSGQRITQELSLGAVVSKTFELYRRDFAKYVVLFAVVETVIGVLTTLVRRSFILPAPPTIATLQQFLNWAPGFFGTLIPLVALTAIVGLVFFPVAVGSAVKMASEEVEKGQADLGASLRFATSKLVWIWALSIVVGVVVVLGLIALVVPGIILGIMFSLVLPVLLIENPGILESLRRSRELVGHRWLKTLALVIVFGIITAISAAVASAISGPFGGASNIVSSLLSAFYQPLIPIALTVYYYSNIARTTPHQASQTPMAPVATDDHQFHTMPTATETPQKTAATYPKTASLLSLAGGVLIMLSGVLLVAASVFILPNLNFSNLTTPPGLTSAGMHALISGVVGVMGTFGLASGVIVLASAVMLLANMGQRKIWGILILVFSILSFIGLGGFIVGAILGIVGGILTLRWKPTTQ